LSDWESETSEDEELKELKAGLTKGKKKKGKGKKKV
jgi:hypothetical protein